MIVLPENKFAKLGQKLGFGLAGLIFFGILNAVSWSLTKAYDRGLIISGILLILLILTAFLGRKYKKWVW